MFKRTCLRRVLVAVALLTCGSWTAYSGAACWKLEEQACSQCISPGPDFDGCNISYCLYVACAITSNECDCAAAWVHLDNTRMNVASVDNGETGMDDFEVESQVECVRLDPCDGCSGGRCVSVGGAFTIWTCPSYQLIGSSCEVGGG